MSLDFRLQISDVVDTGEGHTVAKIAANFQEFRNYRQEFRESGSR